VSELAAIALGLLAGLVGGLLGVGGGILFVPALTLLLDQNQIQAEATSLLAIIPVAIVGAWRQYGYGNVRLRDALVIGALSPVGVVAGAVVANSLSDRALELGFAALILFVAGQLVYRALSEEAPSASPQGPARRPPGPRPDE
jgi:uncharacterized protein